MPATKVMTGVWIKLSQLHLLPVARKHTPEKTASLGRSIQKNEAQLQDIVVCPRDESATNLEEGAYDVLAGGGRKEAEESIGWEKGRCTIMWGLTPLEKLQIMRDENKEREDTAPLDDAQLYQAMLEADPTLTQEKLAEMEGMSQETLSQYLALLTKLSKEAQNFIARAINLKMKHLLEVCKLGSESDQLELLEKGDKEGWTVKKMAAEVSKKLGVDAQKKPVRGKAYDPSAPFQFSKKGKNVMLKGGFSYLGADPKALATQFESELARWLEANPAKVPAPKPQEQGATISHDVTPA